MVDGGTSAYTRPPRLGSWSARLELGLVAFSPAFALMALRFADRGWWWLCFAAPVAIAAVAGVGLFVVLRRTNPEPFKLSSISDAGGEVIGHVSSYVLTAVVDPGGGTGQTIAATAAFCLIVFIHIATGRVHVNPLLYLTGYRVYDAQTTTGNAYYLFARSDPADWGSISRCRQVSASLLFEQRAN